MPTLAFIALSFALVTAVGTLLVWIHDTLEDLLCRRRHTDRPSPATGPNRAVAWGIAPAARRDARPSVGRVRWQAAALPTGGRVRAVRRS